MKDTKHPVHGAVNGCSPFIHNGNPLTFHIYIACSHGGPSFYSAFLDIIKVSFAVFLQIAHTITARIERLLEVWQNACKCHSNPHGKV